MPEITHHCPKTPFLLVGTQIDLRDDPSTVEKLAKNKQKPITPETAEKLARDLKAVKYVECSALTQVRPLATRKACARIKCSAKTSANCIFLSSLTLVLCASLCLSFSSFCSGD